MTGVLREVRTERGTHLTSFRGWSVGQKGRLPGRIDASARAGYSVYMEERWGVGWEGR